MSNQRHADAAEALRSLSQTTSGDPLPALSCLTEEEVLRIVSSGSAVAREQQIGRHLASCYECRLLMQAALFHSGGSNDASVRSPGHCLVFEPGSIVGNRYVIRRFIARGGMGEVYEAFDLERQRPLALKVVRATECDRPFTMARLSSEARLARRVRHPNVCRTFGLSRHVGDHAASERICFMTMELVKGETLRRRLMRQGEIPLGQASEIARDVLEGLAAVHDAGIVHRDIKSDNVMLSTDTRCAVLIDFGLALTSSRAARVEGCEGHRGVSGSPGYMAPEQMLGLPLRPATDLFAFGVVLFETLTGRLPFEPSEVSSSKVGTLRHLGNPSFRVSQALGGAPRGLQEFLARCLSVNPEDRYQDARAALTHLVALEEEVPLSSSAAGSR